MEGCEEVTEDGEEIKNCCGICILSKQYHCLFELLIRHNDMRSHEVMWSHYTLILLPSLSFQFLFLAFYQKIVWLLVKRAPWQPKMCRQANMRGWHGDKILHFFNSFKPVSRVLISFSNSFKLWKWWYICLHWNIILPVTHSTLDAAWRCLS